VDRLDAKTVSGRVTADIDLDQDAALRVATVSGPVAIRLPAGACARVDLRSTTGQVLSEFPGLRHTQMPGANTLSGDLGPGGDAGPAGHPGVVRVSTMSGQVTLLQRSQAGPPRAAAGAAGGSR
jgi:hypothetical protein